MVVCDFDVNIRKLRLCRKGGPHRKAAKEEGDR